LSVDPHGSTDQYYTFMVKQQLEDSFEGLVEEGKSQAKKTVKSAAEQISSSVNVSKMWEQLLGVSDATSQVEEERSDGKTSEIGKREKHTPLNLEKLAKSYQGLEKQKAESLKQRLFQLVKQGEEKILQEKKTEEVEKKQKSEYDVELKKKKDEEHKTHQQGDLPKGKVRRSIFSHKKIAERQHAEVKPAGGKQ